SAANPFDPFSSVWLYYAPAQNADRDDG
ncbi:hypothetical protein pipiens_000402, partial [Culex pipiens pipiens]